MSGRERLDWTRLGTRPLSEYALKAGVAMETTEKIVEAYVRYVKGWATIPNLRCDGQHEIDLLAIDPVTLKRYHIETSVSGSSVYSRLTANEFNADLLKDRVQKAKMRRTVGYFVEHKFGKTPARADHSVYGWLHSAILGLPQLDSSESATTPRWLRLLQQRRGSARCCKQHDRRVEAVCHGS